MSTDLAPRTIANAYTAGKLSRGTPWIVLVLSLAVTLGTALFLSLALNPLAKASCSAW